MNARQLIEDESARDFILRQLAQGKMAPSGLRWEPLAPLEADNGQPLPLEYEASHGGLVYFMTVYYGDDAYWEPEGDVWVHVKCWLPDNILNAEGKPEWSANVQIGTGSLAGSAAKAQAIANGLWREHRTATG